MLREMFPNVSVSLHAVQRLRERFPELASGQLSNQQLSALIAAEVQQAHDGCRVASKCRPRFTFSARQGRKQRGIRFAWTEAEERCYVLDRHRAGVTVITTLKADCRPSYLQRPGLPAAA